MPRRALTLPTDLSALRRRGHSPLLKVPLLQVPRLQVPLLRLPRLRLLPESESGNQPLQKPPQPGGLACRARAAALGVVTPRRPRACSLLRSPYNPQYQRDPPYNPQQNHCKTDGPDRKDERPARAVG